MKICIDDGSTTIKMQWEEGKEVKRFASVNSFRHGFAAAGQASKADNYQCNGLKYTFSPASPDAINTTSVDYQYADVNVVAVHHALHASGIMPQAVDIVVTLPISQYYDADFQANMTNINRKIDNLKKPVERLRAQPFTFNTIEVIPEAWPAALKLLDTLPPAHSLLVVDLGGTTLDMCLIAEGGARLEKILGDETLGVSFLTNEVRAWMAANGTEANAAAVAEIVRNHRDDVNYLENIAMNHDGLGQQLHDAIATAQQNLATRVIAAVRRFTGFNHVLMVGGGAELVAARVQSALNLSDKRFTIASEPQFALADGLYWMTK